MAAGIHIVRKIKTGKPVRWYVYAWRGGPQIARFEGTSRPKVTPELMTAASDAWKKRRNAPSDTISGLITEYLGSPEWKRLSDTTKSTWRMWLDRIEAKFGKAALAAFEHREMRSDILAWRDKWQDQPRSADMAVQVLSRLLGWGMDRTRLDINLCAGISQLYEHNRSDIIWDNPHFSAFNPCASIEVQEAVALAGCTGLRRGDLVKLPWSAVGDHAIIWKTGKSRGKAVVVIPLLPETRTLLNAIRARHAAEMAGKRPNRRKPLPETILSNSRWQAWTPKGLGSRFNDAKQESGIDVNFHDLRGTFATRCMLAGLTDQEIADILGWTTKEVSVIRVKYVDQARVVVAIGERIAATSVNRL